MPTTKYNRTTIEITFKNNVLTFKKLKTGEYSTINTLVIVRTIFKAKSLMLILSLISTTTHPSQKNYRLHIVH